jgi:RNA polymerase sigma factor (sigma-70 family)
MLHDSAVRLEISKFYESSAPRLLAFLVATGFPAQDAADAVQQAILEALPPQWARIREKYSWCRLTAYRRACDIRRRNREVLLDDDFPELGSSLLTDQQAIDAIANDEFLRVLNSRLASAPIQREIMIWTYDGAKPGEIGEALGIKQESVRSSLRAARVKMRPVFDARDDA